MITVAVIGYGFSAKCFHIPFIKNIENFELVAVSTSKVDEFTNQNNAITFYASASELIKKTEAELIIITAPNHVHFTLAKSCLLANKHVILEKPMVTSQEEGEVLISLAEEKGLMLTVYHNRRWDGDFLTVNKLIKNNVLGDIRLFESHFDRFRPLVGDKWKELSGVGTGVLFDLGSHLFDQAIQLFGKPLAITARCLCTRKNSDATDYFNVLLHFKNLEVNLQSSPFCAHHKLRFRIEGTKGSYQKYGFDSQEADLLAGLSLKSEGWGKEAPEYYGSLCTENETEIIPTLAGNYSTFFEGVASAIKMGGKPPVDPEDALFVIHLLQLAEESSKQGKTLYL